MTDLNAKSRTELVIDLMFHALRVTDGKLNTHAAHLVAQLGGEPVSRLVREAASLKNGLSHRLRLLDVIERIGKMPTADDWLILNVIATDKNLQIRHAAARCLVRCPVAGPVTPPSMKVRCRTRTDEVDDGCELRESIQHE